MTVLASDVLAVAYNVTYNLASTILVVDHNTKKVGLAASAAVGSSHSALRARNSLVLAPPEERHGFQALSAASRHREKLLPTCHSDSGHLLFVPHVAAWQ